MVSTPWVHLRWVEEAASEIDGAQEPPGVTAITVGFDKDRSEERLCLATTPARERTQKYAPDHRQPVRAPKSTPLTNASP